MPIHRAEKGGVSAKKLDKIIEALGYHSWEALVDGVKQLRKNYPDPDSYRKEVWNAVTTVCDKEITIPKLAEVVGMPQRTLRKNITDHSPTQKLGKVITILGCSSPQELIQKAKLTEEGILTEFRLEHLQRNSKEAGVKTTI